MRIYPPRPPDPFTVGPPFSVGKLIRFLPREGKVSHVCHSRRPVLADLPTNGFAVTPLSLRLDFSLDEERTGKDLGCRLGRRRFSPCQTTKRNRASCHASHHLQIEQRRVGSQRDQLQAGRLFPLVDRQGCDKQRVHFPLLSPLQPFLYSFRGRRGRLLSTEFMRLPSKRQYADYYQQIQSPIALDEIRSRIETGKYPDLDAVRQDLELCFKNAKKYNMKDSPIWKDAKHLHVCFRH